MTTTTGGAAMKRLPILAAAMLALAGCAYHADPLHPPEAGLVPAEMWCQAHPSPQVAAEVAAVSSPDAVQQRDDMVASGGLIGAVGALATVTPAEWARSDKASHDLERDWDACLARHGWLRN